MKNSGCKLHIRIGKNRIHSFRTILSYSVSFKSQMTRHLPTLQMKLIHRTLKKTTHSFPGQTTPDNNPEQQIYKTTNTLEKLITFTQNLQEELKQAKRDIAVMVDKVEKLENERQYFREMQNVVQDILDQLTQLETMDVANSGP